VLTDTVLLGAVNYGHTLAVGGGYVFFNDGQQHIRRVPITGGIADDLATMNDVTGSPSLTVTNDLLYWRNIILTGSNGAWSSTLYSLPLDAAVGTTSAMVLQGASSLAADFKYLVSDGATLYWSGYDGQYRIKSMPSGGTSPSPIGGYDALRMAVGGGFLALDNNLANGIDALAVRGGAILPIVSNATQNVGWPLATDGTYVYWLNPVSPNCALTRTAIASGTNATLTTLMEDCSSVGDLIVDSVNVYLSQVAGRIVAVPVGGGNATPIAGTQVQASLLAQDAVSIYAAGGMVIRLAK
jgi:hypothetical protein